jgi:uncharacterized membrane protein (DUF373 family)
MTKNSMLMFLKRFERLIAWILAGLLVFVILLATLDLTANLIRNAISLAPSFLTGVDQLLDLFGLFLIIVLGLELLETVKAYLQEDLIHVEVVLIVAIIALARKVIILEIKEPSPLALIGLAALVIALAASYRLIMQVLRNDAGNSSHKKE